MATSVSRVYLTGCNYELAYDLLSQNSANNTSTVRLYGILHVTNNQISWTRGSASVHTSGLQAIGTYYSKGDYVVIQRDFTWSHDANGNFSGYVGASLSTTFVSGDTGGVINLPHIDRFATMTDAISNPNDESDFWFKYSNPANASMSCWLEPNPNGTHYAERTLSGKSGTYTWNLTEEERNQLRAKLANASGGTGKIRIGLFSTLGSATQASYIDRTFTIINANPTFTNFTYADVNSTTTALTGNNQKCIIGYSNIRTTISTSNKATANKQATMSKYQFKCGTNTPVEANYSDSSTVNLTINKVTSGTFDVYAIDSRTNSKKVSKTATTVINYKNISINNLQSGIVRDKNNVGTGAILTLKGTMWKGNFGSVTNALTVTYRLKKTDASSWSTGTTTITPTVDSSGNISYSGSIKSNNSDYSWDLGSSYNVQVIVKDKLSTVTVNLILNSAIPTISLDKNGVGIMCAYNPSIGGLLQVGGRRIDNYITKYIVENATNSYIIDDLNLTENDLLRITILPEFTNSSSMETLRLRVNDITSYHTQSARLYANGSATSQTGITTNSDYIDGTEDNIGIHTMALYSRVSVELFIENGYLGYFSNISRAYSGQQRNQWTFANTNVSINGINKLTFYTDNQQIPAGTKIILEVI